MSLRHRSVKGSWPCRALSQVCGLALGPCPCRPKASLSNTLDPRENKVCQIQVSASSKRFEDNPERLVTNQDSRINNPPASKGRQGHV